MIHSISPLHGTHGAHHTVIMEETTPMKDKGDPSALNSSLSGPKPRQKNATHRIRETRDRLYGSRYVFSFKSAHCLQLLDLKLRFLWIIRRLHCYKSSALGEGSSCRGGAAFLPQFLPEVSSRVNLLLISLSILCKHVSIYMSETEFLPRTLSCLV